HDRNLKKLQATDSPTSETRGQSRNAPALENAPSTDGEGRTRQQSGPTAEETVTAEWGDQNFAEKGGVLATGSGNDAKDMRSVPEKDEEPEPLRRRAQNKVSLRAEVLARSLKAREDGMTSPRTAHRRRLIRMLHMAMTRQADGFVACEW
ncbi:unnamed protein product, partial [Sphacelaria rigidula]